MKKIIFLVVMIFFVATTITYAQFLCFGIGKNLLKNATPVTLGVENLNLKKHPSLGYGFYFRYVNEQYDITKECLGKTEDDELTLGGSLNLNFMGDDQLGVTLIGGLGSYHPLTYTLGVSEGTWGGKYHVQKENHFSYELGIGMDYPQKIVHIFKFKWDPDNFKIGINYICNKYSGFNTMLVLKIKM